LTQYFAMSSSLQWNRVFKFLWWRLVFFAIACVAIILGILGLAAVMVGDFGADIVIIVLGAVVIIGVALDLTMRCNSARKQRWFRGEEIHEEVPLPENYKRHRRNMGDEDSEGDVVVTSGSEETVNQSEPSTTGKTPSKKDADEVMVDIQSMISSTQKTEETKSQKTSKAKKDKKGVSPDGSSGTESESKQ